MTQTKAPAAAANLMLKGGAAIVAPVTAFPSAIPQNALVVIPLKEPSDELKEKLSAGGVVVTPDQMWELLGLHGAPVQVQNQDGNMITIGLEDLLAGLDKNWKEDQADLNRGRIYAQELMKHGRNQDAEKVLAKVVAMGGTGEDWLGLGVAQLAAEQIDKAEGTLKGAQNLLTQSPYPSLHLAKVMRAKKDTAGEREMVEKAIGIDPKCVDAWAYLYSSVRNNESEDAAISVVESVASRAEYLKVATPYVALQGFYSASEETHEKALEFAKKAVERDSDDTLALTSLSALYGQKKDLDALIGLLKNHENKMTRDVRLANNYFEALRQKGDMQKVTTLLNALVASPNREVKQFALERSRFIAQVLQQQAQKVAAVGQSPILKP